MYDIRLVLTDWWVVPKAYSIPAETDTFYAPDPKLILIYPELKWVTDHKLKDNTLSFLCAISYHLQTSLMTRPVDKL